MSSLFLRLTTENSTRNFNKRLSLCFKMKKKKQNHYPDESIDEVQAKLFYISRRYGLLNRKSWLKAGYHRLWKEVPWSVDGTNSHKETWWHQNSSLEQPKPPRLVLKVGRTFGSTVSQFERASPNSRSFVGASSFKDTHWSDPLCFNTDNWLTDLHLNGMDDHGQSNHSNKPPQTVWICLQTLEENPVDLPVLPCLLTSSACEWKMSRSHEHHQLSQTDRHNLARV